MYRLQTTLVLTDVYSIKYFRKFNLNTLMQRTEFFVVTALYGLKSPMTSQFFLEICSNFNSRDSQTYYLANYSRKLYENEKMDYITPSSSRHMCHDENSYTRRLRCVPAETANRQCSSTN